jgi:homoserine kinase
VLTIRVPATAANLGAGFDCLGIALRWFNTITVERAPKTTLVIRGEGAMTLPRDESNLCYQALCRALAVSGCPIPMVTMTMINRIPLARGLGSSSAAIVGGLLAGNAIAGGALTIHQLLDLAAEMEGHPDNVAPALLGGLVVSVLDGPRVIAVPVPLRAKLQVVVLVPNTPLSTTAARAVLPTQVPHKDAVFNLGRAALMVAALATGRPDTLSVAVQDRLHQPYRTQLFPPLPVLINAALEAGALGACLSGAGPSILALSSKDKTTAIATALGAAARAVGVLGQVYIRGLSRRGASLRGEL